MDIRKTMMIKETIEADGVGKACDPITRVVAVAVIRNPFAGRFVEDLSPLFDIGGQLGERLMADAVKMLAGPPVSYGKGSHRRRCRRYGARWSDAPSKTGQAYACGRRRRHGGRDGAPVDLPGAPGDDQRGTDASADGTGQPALGGGPAVSADHRDEGTSGLLLRGAL